MHKKRHKQIVDVTRRRFMPPWQPAPGHGEFAGARRLTDEQIQTLAEWVKAGAPRGEHGRFAGGSEIRRWLAVGQARPSARNAANTSSWPHGGDQFRNFVIPIDIKTPKWVESIELRPTNPRATHHARLGVDRTQESVRRDADDRKPGYEGMAWGQDPDGQLVTWVPGMVAQPAMTGTAWRLYPRTSLVLHTHMQPTGKMEMVQFQSRHSFREAIANAAARHDADR